MGSHPPLDSFTPNFTFNDETRRRCIYTGRKTEKKTSELIEYVKFAPRAILLAKDDLIEGNSNQAYSDCKHSLTFRVRAMLP